MTLSIKIFILFLTAILLISATSQVKERGAVCAGGIIFHPSNPEKVVIVMGKRGKWSLPKGHVEEGETPFEAAKREIYEETGLTDLIFERELGSYERAALKNDGKESYREIKTIHMFLFRTQSTHLQPVDPANPEAKWVTARDCLKHLTYQQDKEFFEKRVIPIMQEQK